MVRLWIRVVLRWLVVVFVAATLPFVPSTDAAAPPLPEAVPPRTPPVTVPPMQDPHLPSLVLDLAVTPNPLPLGATASFTLTVTNQAPDPANDLVLTLPVPSGVTALTGPTVTPASQPVWRWQPDFLGGRSERLVTGTLRLDQAQVGDALVLRPAATARGLALPVTIVGGALTAPPATTQRASPATTTFTPGHATTLQSQDGQLRVAVPANLAADRVRLTHRTFTAAPADLRTLPAPIQAALAAPPRGFAPFLLDATDRQGASIHHFAQPATIQARYTPQQLQVLGIAEHDLTLWWLNDHTGVWQPLPATLDPDQRAVQAQVEQAGVYQLGDDTPPAAAFIPALQPFQVGLFTGSTHYRIPIALPAGPGGHHPTLELTYDSNATDGGAGLRTTTQAGWVGKGWSLETGAIARTQLRVSDATTVDHFSLILDGQSLDLTRGDALVAQPSDARPSDWRWHPTDETFLRVTVVPDGLSTPATRGGVDHTGTPIPRYRWIVWAKDGTRYEFAEDLWWGWCVPNRLPSLETYRWLLSSVSDTFGNRISYSYARDSLTTAPSSGCGAIAGTLDRDAWPTEIRWGANPNTGSTDRYRVRLVSAARTNDTAFATAAYQLRGNQGAPRQTRQLDALIVESKPADSWLRVREYRLGYDYSLWSDASICTAQCGSGSDVYGPDPASPKLTLRSVQQVGMDGTSALPATTFSYGARGTAKRPDGGFNRLTAIDTGSGGVVALAYDHVATAQDDNLFWNYHRLRTRTLQDGQGNTMSWTYQYGTPAMNTLGTQLGGNGPQRAPNSATLYYNRFRQAWRGDANTLWLVHQPHTEFRGHATVRETDPSGAQTEYWFYQGDYRPETTDTACVPSATNSSIATDACFLALRDREVLKGRVWRTRRLGADGLVQTETEQRYAVEPLSSFPPDAAVGRDLAGLWRAFSYAAQTVTVQLEGGSTPVVQTTRYEYRPSAQGGTQYGNLTHIHAYVGDGSGTPLRTTSRTYTARVGGDDYLVDRQIGETVTGDAGELLAVTHHFYDGQLSWGTLGPRGARTLTRAYTTVPPQGCCVGMTLQGTDTGTTYDPYGNLATVTTYTEPGTYTADTNTWSGAGNGSLARTTTTHYDDIVHAFPVTVTNALDQTTITRYDLRMGTRLSVSDANDTPSNDTTIAMTYDGFGRLATVVKPGDSAAFPTVQLQYHDTARPVRISTIVRETPGATGGTRPLSQFYDGLGRPIQTKHESVNGQQNIVIDTRYDGLDRPMQVAQARYVDEIPAAQPGSQFWSYTPVPASGLRWTTTTYDARDRPLRVTAPDGTWREYHYGVADGLTYTDAVDPNRHRTQRRYDALGRLRAVLELRGDCGLWSYPCSGTTTTPWAVEATTSYTYDGQDRLTQLTDTLGNRTTLAYDSGGRLIGRNDPDLGQRAAPDYGWVFSYDTNGNLRTQRDNKNQTLWFDYDALDRPLEKRQGSRSGPLLASSTYDQGTNGIGQRTGMAVPQVASTSWTYDTRGRMRSALHTVAALAQPRRFLWRYDSADRVTALTYPNNDTLSATYNAAGQPLSAESSLSGVLVQRATYTALDQPTSRTLGHDLVAAWSYQDAQARLTRLTVAGLFDRSYTYDAGGNIRSITDHTGSQPLQAYRYDHRARLTHWTLGSTTQQYTYDRIGNLLSKPDLGTYTYPAAGNPRPHAPSSIGGQPATYDANGNLADGQGRQISWTWENRPQRITMDGVTETYAYDADGERISVTRAGTTHVSLEGLWEERAGTGSGRALFPFNGQIVAEREGQASRVVYLHSDHLGSISVATTTTASGSAVLLAQQEFDPWGAVRAGGIAQTTRNYTGQHLDASGLLYYHARSYDPVTARFLSADSLIPDPTDPQDLNRYAYVKNNPLRYTDPTGHAYHCSGIDCGSVATRRAAGADAYRGGGGSVASGSTVVTVAGTVAAYAAPHLPYAAKGSNYVESRYTGETRTAGQIINDEKKGGINSEFPEEWKDKTPDEIYKSAKSGNRTARTAKKLLDSKEYDKGSKK